MIQICRGEAFALQSTKRSISRCPASKRDKEMVSEKLRRWSSTPRKKALPSVSEKGPRQKPEDLRILVQEDEKVSEIGLDGSLRTATLEDASLGDYVETEPW